MNNRVGTIVLSGGDATRFVDLLYRSSDRDRRQMNSLIASIEDNVAIRPIDNGFEADVVGLDLSFLNRQLVKVETKFSVVNNIDYYMDERDYYSAKFVVKDNGDFFSSMNEEWFLWAA